ncbi:MAG: YggS family pyridoxal phosphate-dependent enzyme [Candidatus Omnitrophica bacterium]|nr:YggS family pyridoxal phosphate-dependent enzyme [Candidatus Omnitrophota bacterium]
MLTRQLREVKERVDQACRRSKRDPKQIKLVLVTKEVEMSRIEQAYELGIRDFGENRVRELLAKAEQLPKDIQWHFIGSLQTNKIKSLIGRVVLIHSLDRIELAREIEKEAAKQDQTVDLLIQVNTSREETKHGFKPEEVETAVSEIIKCGHLNVRGLMTIGPLTEDQERIRESFCSLLQLRDRLKQNFDLDWHYLSMGMSSDFEIAVEEGANLLRIGTAVFGPRL